MPAASALSLRCGGLDKLDQRWFQSQRMLGPGRGPGPPPIEPVEMPAASAPSLRCGGLDSSTSGASVPAHAWTRTGTRATAHRACRDARSVGSQPSLRRSRRADQRCFSPSACLDPDGDPGHRPSSLSRCPQRRLPAFAAAVSSLDQRCFSPSACLAAAPRWSTAGRAEPGPGTVPPPIEPVEMPAASAPSLRCGGTDSSTSGASVPAHAWTRTGTRATAHRACRDARSVGSQPSLRRPRQATSGASVPAHAWQVSRG